MGLKINSPTEIYDNGEFVTIVTETGVTVHLPVGQHSITLHSSETVKKGWDLTSLTVDFHTD